MKTDAKLKRLLASPDDVQIPFIETLLDAIAQIDLEWDIALSPSLEATRAVLAAFVIDVAVCKGDDGNKVREFDRRFARAFRVFQLRMKKIHRRGCDA